MTGKTEGALRHAYRQVPTLPVIKIVAGEAGEFAILHRKPLSRQLPNRGEALLPPRRGVGNPGRMMTGGLEGMALDTDSLTVHPGQMTAVVLRAADNRRLGTAS